MLRRLQTQHRKAFALSNRSFCDAVGFTRARLNVKKGKLAQSFVNRVSFDLFNPKHVMRKIQSCNVLYLLAAHLVQFDSFASA